MSRAIKLAPDIDRVPGRCGGDPCIEGTRLTTRTVSHMVRDLGEKWVSDQYPWLAEKPSVRIRLIRAAVKWEREHPTPPADWDDMTPTERRTVLQAIRQGAKGKRHSVRALVEALAAGLERDA